MSIQMEVIPTLQCYMVHIHMEHYDMTCVVLAHVNHAHDLKISKICRLMCS